MATETLRADHSEISWPLDNTTVYGTLVKPAGPGPFPGVVMVAGSGPTDRDWNSPLIPGSNGSARLIADALAENGFASLRYDKRASGPHVAETLPALVGKMSMQSHLDELTSAVQMLAQQGSVDSTRIFALTNSEGALHALNYQVHQPAIPFAGLVLAAPPGPSRLARLRERRSTPNCPFCQMLPSLSRPTTRRSPVSRPARQFSRIPAAGRYPDAAPEVSRLQ